MKTIKELTYKLENANIDIISENCREFLESINVERAEEIKTKLSIENALLYWQEKFGPEHPVVISFQKTIKKNYIQLTCDGEKACPFTDNGDEADTWTTSILNSFNNLPVFDYKHNSNSVRFCFYNKKKNPLLNLLICVAAGLIIGFAGLSLNQEVRTVISEVYLNSIYSAYLSAFSVCGIPLIFLSVMNGIIGVGNLSTFSKIGKKMTLRFLVFIVGVVFASVLFAVYILETEFKMSAVYLKSGDLLGIILSMLPTGLISPFVDSNALQLIVLGVAFGICVLVMNASNGYFAKLMNDLNNILVMIMGWIASLIPLFILIGLVKTIWQSSADVIISLASSFAYTTAFQLFIIFVLVVAVSLKYKVSIAVICRKLAKVFFIALGTNSCAASIPANCECCSDGFGIDPKLFSLGIPIGTTIFKPATAVRLVFICLFMVYINGMTVSFSWIILMMILCFFISIAVPAIPGGVIMLCGTLFAALDIPADSINQLLSIDGFFDFTCTALNQIAVPLMLVLFAGKHNLLNVETLRKL